MSNYWRMSSGINKKKPYTQEVLVWFYHFFPNIWLYRWVTVFAPEIFQLKWIWNQSFVNKNCNFDVNSCYDQDSSKGLVNNWNKALCKDFDGSCWPSFHRVLSYLFFEYTGFSSTHTSQNISSNKNKTR